jgi:hypothetical protein
MSDQANELVAYYSGGTPPPVRIKPGDRRRNWIEAMPDRWANRCLPLLVATEAGWVIENPVAFRARWLGRDDPGAITIEFDEADTRAPHLVHSGFGYGVLSWDVPFLFRTPPGFNLLARGPANDPKDGIGALEGIVETDWAVATFTMNWKFTRAEHWISFSAGEPFCMLVPQRRAELERFVPKLRPLADDPELEAEARAWSFKREDTQKRKFLAEFSSEYRDDISSWERDYFQGRLPTGGAAPEHQTKLKLRPFEGRQ